MAAKATKVLGASFRASWGSYMPDGGEFHIEVETSNLLDIDAALAKFPPRVWERPPLIEADEAPIVSAAKEALAHAKGELDLKTTTAETPLPESQYIDAKGEVATKPSGGAVDVKSVGASLMAAIERGVPMDAVKGLILRIGGAERVSSVAAERLADLKVALDEAQAK